MNNLRRADQSMQPTMNLRFIKRASRDASTPDSTGYKFILQQRWKARDGRSQWVDVPRFDPFTEADDDAGSQGQG